MTVAQEIPVSSYLGNGTTTVFNVGFYVRVANELTVQVNGVDATVGSWSYGGGSVTFLSAPAAGVKVVFARKTPLLRTESYTNYSNRLRADVIDADFDRLWLVAQEVGEKLGRALIVPNGTNAAAVLAQVLQLLVDFPAEVAARIAGDDALRAYVNTLAGGFGSFTAADIVDVRDYPDATGATATAYLNNLPLLNPSVGAKLVCNPTAGDDIKNMSLWAANGHLMARGSDLVVEVADGYHDVNTAITIAQTRRLRLQGTGSPDLLQVTAVSFALVSGNIYTATITVSAALPARVVVGYAIGCQNMKASDGKIESLNGAHIIKSIAGDRLSFAIDLRAYGDVPISATTMQNTTTLGLLANRIVIAKNCLRLNPAGWDGSTVEGFLNAVGGGCIDLKNIALSYAGINDNHNIVFERGAGTSVNFGDYVVIAGAGDKVLRGSNGADFYINRSFFGGGLTAAEIWQGYGGATISMARAHFGSVSASCITTTANAHATLTQCIAGSSGGATLRSTYNGSSIEFLTGRINHGRYAAQVNDGMITVSDDTIVARCTDPWTVSRGYLYGNPTLSENLNPAIAGNTVQPQGGGWYQTLSKLIDPNFRLIGVTTTVLDYPSIAAGGFADLTVTVADASIGDHVDYNRNNAGEVAQGIVYMPFVSAANTVTLRAFNVSTAAIDKTAFTARIVVTRFA